MREISSRSLTRETAAWATSLRYADIPARVIALAKSQAASVFASGHAGLLTDAGKQIMAATRRHAPAGNSPVIATGETFHLESALMANAALGMAQDYDDYVFMGHTGHSAVWTAFLVGAATGASGEDILAAQMAANEIGGRLGAACILGPQNGQLWTHIHLAETVVAAGRLYGLTEDQMADALGIAYAQPVYGLFPGFMGPGSKLLSAATPMAIGLRAVQYAQAGLGGSRTVFEDPQGFLRHFAYRPIATMLSGWGTAWITDTLAVKPYPGCAYIDTTIDAILEIRARILTERGAAALQDIKSISVAASMLTIEMNRLSGMHLDESSLTPININFNIPINAAIALLYGELGSKQLTDGFLRDHRDAIVTASHKIELTHDWEATFDLLSDLDGSVGAARFFSGFSRDDVDYIRTRARRDGHARLDAAWSDTGAIFKTVFGQQGAPLRSLVGKNIGAWWRGRGKNGEKKSPLLTGVDFTKVHLPFRSRVAVTLSSGDTFEAECRLPRGSAAKGDVHEVSKEKLERELRLFCSPKHADAAWGVLTNLETLGAVQVLEAVSAPAVAATAKP